MAQSTLYTKSKKMVSSISNCLQDFALHSFGEVVAYVLFVVVPFLLCCVVVYCCYVWPSKRKAEREAREIGGTVEYDEMDGEYYVVPPRPRRDGNGTPVLVPRGESRTSNLDLSVEDNGEPRREDKEQNKSGFSLADRNPYADGNGSLYVSQGPGHTVRLMNAAPNYETLV